MLCLFFFFFQAEDGIRDIGVTGVQTCALPISCRGTSGARASRRRPGCGICIGRSRAGRGGGRGGRPQIGRASCRERGERSVVGGSVKQNRKEDIKTNRDITAKTQR